ncbi:MAG TPA: helix-turn-helix domain-containing protein [Rubrivivax sp.]|nr:helix-turn-helix domain-containing protein [Rubrivivax sp.]
MRDSDESCGLRRTRVAHDADEHAHNLSAWEQRYSQFSSGRFEGRLTELRLPGLQIFQESANQALRQSCTAWPDAVWMGVPCALTGELRIDSRTVPEHTVLLRPGGQEFELQTPRDFGILGIVVGRELLRQHGEADSGLSPRALAERASMPLPPPAYRRLRRMLQLLLVPTAPRLGEAGIRERALVLVTQALAAAGPAPGAHGDKGVKPCRSRELVRKACEIALDGDDPDLAVAGLCRALGVSRRSLQYAFREATGLAPLAYLRLMRLNRARRRLQEAARSGARVTEIAIDCGFNHLGQFARDYRRLFGQTPSATLRESRARAIAVRAATGSAQ